MKCWANDPADRPTFTELAESIGNLLQDSVKQVCFKHMIY